jgi:hypothetical protein
MEEERRRFATRRSAVPGESHLVSVFRFPSVFLGAPLLRADCRAQQAGR